MTRSEIEDKLAALGLRLPEPVAPIANYVPWLITGSQVWISGQVSLTADGDLITGQVGDDGLSVDEAIDAARHCAVNILAQLSQALEGDMHRIVRLVRLNGFVNAGAGFTHHPKVINGASDLMVACLGDAGKHTRIAVGASSLPLDAAVEVDAVFEVTT
ncbi:MAG: RidA family protein [Alphaproteobacteria bacterium]